MTTVPRLWPDSTVVILGCGPSLDPADLAYVREKARVLCINAAHEAAPWADVMYCADAAYYRHVKGAPSFLGLKFSVDQNAAKWGVHVLKMAGTQGLSLEPTHLALGQQSGYQAINLAVHLGATRILLLGYDMRVVGGRKNFSRNYPSNGSGNYTNWARHFDTMVGPLKQLGVEVINCTTGSALKTFPSLPLSEALPHALEVAS